MSETYLITAKTVEEAISIANREYADAEHEVSYEILEMPKKGFLGFGAKDAKIKITVTKSQSVELGSLVADIKNMKSITNRGGEGERREKKNPQSQQKKQAQPQSGAKNPHQSHEVKHSAESKAEHNVPHKAEPKTEAKAEPKNSQKPAQTAQKQPRPKQEFKQELKQETKSDVKPVNKAENRPASKADAKSNQQNPANAKHENKPEAAQKPQPKKTEQRDKIPEKVPEKIQEKTVEKIPEKTEVKESSAAASQVPVKQAADEKKREEKYSSSLGNQVKQRNRRGDTVKKTPVQNEISSSGVTVSTPVGLSDFVGGEKGGFGSNNYESGKISNDVKKKTKITDPAKANMDALKALTAPTPTAPVTAPVTAAVTAPAVSATESAAETAVESVKTPAKNAETQKNNQKDAQRENRKDNSKDSDKRKNKKPAQPQKAEKTAQEAKPEANQPAEKKLREAVTQEEMDCALEFANTLLENMKLDARAYPAEPDEGEEFIINGDANVYPKINIGGEDTGILIGHHGETLDSIQYLINLSALRKSKQKDGDYVRIVVDIEGYREKREETLRALARRMAARAVKYKRNIFLEPMNAYERRIIHSELQSFENVSTHSVGADRDRKIIITYEGSDKRERPDRRSETRSDADVEKIDDGNIAGNAVNSAVNSAASSAVNSRKKRKPNKLPIDKLTDLLDSREEAVADEAQAEEFDAAIVEDAEVEIPEEIAVEIPEELPDEISEESAEENFDGGDADESATDVSVTDVSVKDESVESSEADVKKDEADE